MTRLLMLALCLGSLAGCNSHEAKAQPAKPTNTVDDTRALCVQMFTKARECTADYIPALVDARARHDNPPGITEAVKNDRDAVIAEANKEWETDSKDENIAATCDKISAQLVAQEQGSIDTLEGCLAQSDCKQYTSCVMPLFEKRFHK